MPDGKSNGKSNILRDAWRIARPYWFSDDRWAARGLRFAQATTVAPLTLPAHASLMTGTFPARQTSSIAQTIRRPSKRQSGPSMSTPLSFGMARAE